MHPPVNRAELGRPRERVWGSGPDRKFLPPFQEICRVPEEVIQDLLSYYLNHFNLNDLEDSTNYGISDVCSLKQVIPSKFQHLLLTLPGDKNPYREENYTEWRPDTKDTRFYKWFQNHFPEAFRVRISVLQPHTEFSWHIDTNTSVACRCSASLNQVDSKFEIRARGKVYSNALKRGRLTFTNTGWSHRVYNPTNEARINLVFSIKFDGLKNYMTPSPKSLY